MFPEGIAMADAQPLALVLPASRSVFAGIPTLRVIEYSEDHRFIPLSDLTRDQIKGCSMLGYLHGMDATPYLAEYSGIPGIVKGVQTWGSGMLVFTENLKHFTEVCSARVLGNKIKFGYGSEEIKQERRECWEFCVKRVRIDVITKMKRDNAVEFPLVLSRPEDIHCPVCYDELTANNMECDNKHQVCLPCFKLLPGIGGLKKCPCCNTNTYSTERIDRYNAMIGKEIKQPPYFYLSLRGGNSMKDFQYNEALFMGLIKRQAQNQNFDIFRRMLMSSFYNFYINHSDRFSYNFNLLNQVDGNNRTYNPSKDDLSEPIIEYINEIDDPKIYNDVKFTDIYLGGYDDVDFHRQLRDIDGGGIERISEYPNQSIALLRREIYFRYKIKHSNANELMEYFRNIFYRVITNINSSIVFKYVTIEE